MTSTDSVCEILRRDIITCALQPGQQVAQSSLAKRYKVGMTPMREALQRLAGEGFVQAIPRFGYIVTPVTLADVSEIYELRTCLELPAARLAAVRATDEQLQRLVQEAGFTYLYGDPSSYSDFLARNAGFHRAVAVASGNGRLAESVSRLLDQMTRIFHLGLDLRDSAAEMRSEHLLLARALAERDAGRAEQIVHSQIQRSQQRVVEAMLRGFAATPPKDSVQNPQIRL